MSNKALVVFYSWTGNTKKAAQEIAKILKAEVDEISELKPRKRIFLNWLRAGRDALFGRTTEIRFKTDPKKYNIVVVGTPVWAGRPVPAITSYLRINKLTKVAFFCTCSFSTGRTFKVMEKISNIPVATLCLKNKQYDKRKIRQFCCTVSKAF